MTPNFWLQRAYEEDGKVIAVLMNEYTEELEEREVDQLVIENGIIPNDSLYWSLREESSNGGIIEINELYDHQPQPALSNILKASSRCSVLGIASASTTFTGRFMTPFGSQRTLGMSQLIVALLVIAFTGFAVGVYRRMSLWRQGQAAAFSWMLLAQIPKRYLVDLHHIVARDKYIANTHVAAAGGVVGSVVMLVLIYFLGFKNSLTYGVLWGLLVWV